MYSLLSHHGARWESLPRQILAFCSTPLLCYLDKSGSHLQIRPRGRPLYTGFQLNTGSVLKPFYWF